MNIPANASLLRLSNTGLVLADASQDVRGLPVKDVEGATIGKVVDLLIDDTEKRVRFLLVSTGGVLGIGEERFLVPVDAIAAIHKDHVHIARTRDHVTSGPRYDPQVTHEQQEPLFADAYAFYGVLPFWAAGYAYPGFPYYV
jgi:sporulation protein YlmC with PRC-barrel domain